MADAVGIQQLPTGLAAQRLDEYFMKRAMPIWQFHGWNAAHGYSLETIPDEWAGQSKILYTLRLGCEQSKIYSVDLLHNRA